MKHFHRNVLLLITSVLVVVQAILGNIVANQLQDALGTWASYVLPTFLLITLVLLGYTLWQDDQSHSNATHDLNDQRHGAFVSGSTTYGPVIGDSSGSVSVSYTFNDSDLPQL